MIDMHKLVQCTSSDHGYHVIRRQWTGLQQLPIYSNKTPSHSNIHVSCNLQWIYTHAHFMPLNIPKRNLASEQFRVRYILKTYILKLQAKNNNVNMFRASIVPL